MGLASQQGARRQARAAMIVLLVWASLAASGCDGDTPDEHAGVQVAREPITDALLVQTQGDKVAIDVLYSPEKAGWLEEMVTRFEAEHPHIDVVLESRGSLEAVHDLVAGRERPTVWSPADMVAVELLREAWPRAHGERAPVATLGPDRPRPLVLTPLVFVTWRSRGEALTADGTQPMGFARLHEALLSPAQAPLAGPPLRLGHADPLQSSSGVQVLIALASEFHDTRRGLELDAVVDPAFQAYMVTLESAVPQFEATTGAALKAMIHSGPSRYDVVLTYENLALELLPTAQQRWGELRVYHPTYTVWSSHPAVLLEAPWVSASQRAAARELLAYLQARPAQERALAAGFRPADASLPLVGEVIAGTPFEGAAALGVSLEPLPPAVAAPSGEVIRALLAVWRQHLRP